MINKKLIASDIISAALLLLFLYTAINKIIDHGIFKDALSQTPHLQHFAATIAWLLPVIEIGVSILLFIPSTRLKGLYASLILLILLTVYLIYMVLFAPTLPCNCGGVIQQLRGYNIYSLIYFLSCCQLPEFI